MIVRRGRYMVRVSRESLMGDPFWGFFGKVFKGLGKGIGALAKGLLGFGSAPMMEGGGMPMGAFGLPYGLLPGGTPPPVSMTPQMQGVMALPTTQGIMTAAGGGFGLGQALGRRAARALGLGGGAMGMGRRRRMNPGNFRALGRALRRLESFERRARRVVRITSPGRRVHGFKIKKRRRR
jgi:hypothetical protein